MPFAWVHLSLLSCQILVYFILWSLVWGGFARLCRSMLSHSRIVQRKADNERRHTEKSWITTWVLRLGDLWWFCKILSVSQSCVQREIAKNRTYHTRYWTAECDRSWHFFHRRSLRARQHGVQEGVLKVVDLSCEGQVPSYLLKWLTADQMQWVWSLLCQVVEWPVLHARVFGEKLIANSYGIPNRSAFNFLHLFPKTEKKYHSTTNQIKKDWFFCCFLSIHKK
jgi:hypothetical protein